MEYIAAFSLITQNSNETISSDVLRTKIVALLKAVEAPVSEESLNLFLSKVDGKSPSEIIAAGSELMKSQIASGPAAAKPAETGSAAKAAAPEPESSESAELDFF